MLYFKLQWQPVAEWVVSVVWDNYDQCTMVLNQLYIWLLYTSDGIFCILRMYLYMKIYGNFWTTKIYEICMTFACSLFQDSFNAMSLHVCDFNFNFCGTGQEYSGRIRLPPVDSKTFLFKEKHIHFRYATFHRYNDIIAADSVDSCATRCPFY